PATSSWCRWPSRPRESQLSRPIPEPSPSHHNGSGANLKVLASGGKVVTDGSGRGGAEVDGVRARAHGAQTRRADGDPRHVPATQAEPALDDGVTAQVVDAAGRRVVDVEHPVAVARQHE